MSKRALILGVGGQDGSYLADILLEKDYEVHGFIRRSSVDNTVRVKHALNRITMHHGDLTDYSSVERAVAACNPHEIYNEADQDVVGWSKESPLYSYQVTFAAVGNLLEVVRKSCPDARVFQPASATMFQGAAWPQDESAPLTPQSPYAVAKAGAYLMARYYRQVHGLFVSTGILYNHDSPRRSEDFLVHKICRSAIRLADNMQNSLKLGNLTHQVDIGHAREYMEAAHAMLQLSNPDDFVLSTSHPTSVGALADYALEKVGLEGGVGKWVLEDSAFISKSDKQDIPLVGDNSKAHQAFGFDPQLYGWKLIDSIITELQQ